MNASATASRAPGRRRWSHPLALLAIACSAGALAQVVTVPDAHLHHAEGSMAHAPRGETEWQDIAPRRVLKRGDRLWTDRGSRAELQAGGHAVRMDGQTQLVLESAEETLTQLGITQGSIVATVVGLNPGDSFEVGTPNLALRARQAGDYRIDVDPRAGTTRVTVLSGTAVAFGAQGEAVEIRTGQRASFRDRDLTRVPEGAFAATDDFDRWAGARKRGEPTVRMPALAQLPPSEPLAPARSGRTIVISGEPAALPGARPGQAAPAARAAAPLRVMAPATAVTATPALAQVPAAAIEAAARAQAAAVEAAAEEERRAEEHAQQRRAEEQAQQRRAEEDKRLAQERKAQEQRRAAADAQARAQQEQRRAEARRAEQERREATAQKRKAAQEHKRLAQARKAEEQKRLAQARKAEEEQRRQAAARKAQEERRLAQQKQRLQAEKLAEARRERLARLRAEAASVEKAAREAQARAVQQARREEEVQRQELARRTEQARRAEQARREELARREDEEMRRQAAEQRQRALADQWRREHEVWLRHNQPNQPVRPAPMGVPIRRVS